MPLTESEMQRIAEEEIYRQEIKARLEKEKPSRTPKETAWEYLNSPLALWFLSTVVVGLVTLAYTNYQTSAKKTAENREMAQRLTAEVNNRQKETLKLLARIKEESKEVFYEPRWIYKTSVNFLDGEKESALTAYQPVLEFKEKNWATLLNDLEKVAGAEASGTPGLRKKYEVLKTRWDQTPAHDNEGKPTDEDRIKTVEAANKVAEIINSP